MNLYRDIIVISWLVLIIAWVVLAMVFGGGGSDKYSARGMRLIFVIGVVMGMLYGGHILVLSIGDQYPALPASGAVLCSLGLVFATWARVVLGRNWGMPMTVHADPELITSGPYHYVRHPIYTGLIAMWIGTLLVYPPGVIPVVGVIMYILISAVREEHDMERRFPEAYPAYRKRSKMLLPFLI